MGFSIPRLTPRELTSSDRVWIAVTIAVGIVGTCQGVAPGKSRARAASARAAAAQRTAPPRQEPPPARRDP